MLYQIFYVFSQSDKLKEDYDMKATVFNPVQMQLLEMMSFVKSDKALNGLKQAISDYFAT